MKLYFVDRFVMFQNHAPLSYFSVDYLNQYNAHCISKIEGGTAIHIDLSL